MSGAPSCNVMYYTMEACGDDSAKPGAFKLTKKEMVACLFEKATGTTGEDEGGIKGVRTIWQLQLLTLRESPPARPKTATLAKSTDYWELSVRFPTTMSKGVALIRGA